ncbi:MAG: hypothetical protein GX640_14365 [Fibrobacter sp.]|nr:hypothetical protein [Fibrobacter sp.]
MRKILFCILIYSSLVYSGDYSTDLCVGTSLSLNRLGPFVSIGPNLHLGKYFSIGLHADYSWNTIKTERIGFREGFHVPDAAVVPKLHIPINTNVGFFAELDPGFGLYIHYIRYNSASMHDVSSGFSLTCGTGVEIKSFEVGFKYKIQVLAPDRVVFYIGYLGD